MKAIYTEAAKIELENFLANQKTLLEQRISERKSVLGDDVLEITASDVKSVGWEIQVRRPLPRMRYTELLSSIYMIAGVSTMAGSFFYQKIIDLYTANQTQAAVFIVGAGLTLIGFVTNMVVKNRRRLIGEVSYEQQKLREAEDEMMMKRLREVKDELVMQKFHEPDHDSIIAGPLSKDAKDAISKSVTTFKPVD
jgi:hypothetical protein